VQVATNLIGGQGLGEAADEAAIAESEQPLVD